MFPKFDPFDELEQLKAHRDQTIQIVQQLTAAVRQLQATDQQIIDQLNQQTGALNALDANQQDHDGRLRLIEITRQYENQTTSPRS
jgi:chromosome segregation ATPase